METTPLPQISIPSTAQGSEKPGILNSMEALLAVAETEGKNPKLRVRQVRQWILQRGVVDFDKMTDLPASFREKLKANFSPLSSRIVNRQVSSDETEKLLVRFSDGKEIECVLMREENRRTACVSTQVGCGMGCVFCASGINGVSRNLTAGEILEQLVHVRARLTETERLSHVVVMGMGEPMANLTNLLLALESACSPAGFGLSARHITISTVGLPEKIREFANAGKKYHLAVSLHAPEEDMRTHLMPTNAKTGIQNILDAADYFFDKTGRQVTFEYILLAGLNDTPRQAEMLGNLLSHRKSHVNLIPFNPVPGLEFRRPTPDAVREFRMILDNFGVSSTVRKRKGADISAACGQLRRESLAAQETGAQAGT